MDAAVSHSPVPSRARVEYMLEHLILPQITLSGHRKYVAFTSPDRLCFSAKSRVRSRKNCWFFFKMTRNMFECFHLSKIKNSPCFWLYYTSWAGVVKLNPDQNTSPVHPCLVHFCMLYITPFSSYVLFYLLLLELLLLS